MIQILKQSIQFVVDAKSNTAVKYAAICFALPVAAALLAWPTLYLQMTCMQNNVFLLDVVHKFVQLIMCLSGCYFSMYYMMEYRVDQKKLSFQKIGLLVLFFTAFALNTLSVFFVLGFSTLWLLNYLVF